jgi:hypothetical protein
VCVLVVGWGYTGIAERMSGRDRIEDSCCTTIDIF